MAAVEHPNEPASLPMTYLQLLLFFVFGLLASAMAVSILSAPLQVAISGARPELAEFFAAAQLGLIFATTTGAVGVLRQMSWGENADEGSSGFDRRAIQIIGFAAFANLVYVYTILLLSVWAAGAVASYSVLVAFAIPLADRVLAEYTFPSIGIGVVLGFLLSLHLGGLFRDVSYRDVPVMGLPRRVV